MNQPAPTLPAGVDFTTQEAMTAPQLQHLLRQDFNGPELANVSVVVSKPLMPWMMTLSGGLNIYGNVHFWETEIDIRAIEKTEDFLNLVGDLHKVFARAADSVSKGAA